MTDKLPMTKAETQELAKSYALTAQSCATAERAQVAATLAVAYATLAVSMGQDKSPSDTGTHPLDVDAPDWRGTF